MEEALAGRACRPAGCVHAPVRTRARARSCAQVANGVCIGIMVPPLQSLVGDLHEQAPSLSLSLSLSLPPPSSPPPFLPPPAPFPLPSTNPRVRARSRGGGRGSGSWW